MKKTILVLATAVSFNAATSLASDNTFYVKANVGMSKLLDVKISGATLYRIPNVKMKSKNDVHIGMGVGYHIQDNARVDIILDHYLNPNYKTKVIKNLNNNNIELSSEIKTDINTLLLNGYFDIYSIDSLKIFIGGGLGLSSIKSKVMQKATDTDDGEVLLSGSSKNKKINGAFAGYLGAGYQFTEGMTAEISYIFRHLGSIGKENAGSLNAHHVTAGVRFDL